MNRTIPLICSVLLAAACDDFKKTTPESVERRPRPTTATEQPVVKERVEADNTGVNVRDREDTVLPTDQGNSSAETAITADIRKGMMAEKSLSFAAKNVKVMTNKGHVTLRGPVKSSEERTLIAAVAARTEGVSDVDNQLEVNP